MSCGESWGLLPERSFAAATSSSRVGSARLLAARCKSHFAALVWQSASHSARLDGKGLVWLAADGWPGLAYFLPLGALLGLPRAALLGDLKGGCNQNSRQTMARMEKKGCSRKTRKRWARREQVCLSLCQRATRRAEAILPVGYPRLSAPSTWWLFASLERALHSTASTGRQAPRYIPPRSIQRGSVLAVTVTTTAEAASYLPGPAIRLAPKYLTTEQVSWVRVLTRRGSSASRLRRPLFAICCFFACASLAPQPPAFAFAVTLKGSV